jgi:hypothetical protein
MSRAIFGPSTDTYDILGLLDDVKLEETLKEQSVFEECLMNALKTFQGIYFKWKDLFYFFRC